MVIQIIYLIISLALILLGANYLTDGASSIAKRLRISELVIGLTIVAFGTSAPELTVSLQAAFSGSDSIALGNVVGSNILNILLILGLTALISPLKVDRSMVKVQMPICILATAVLSIMCFDGFLVGRSPNGLDRIDGLILLAFFLLFLAYTFSIARNNDESALDGTAVKRLPIWLSTLMIVGGLAALIFGGKIFVGSAVQIATALGVSESIIALTLVAVGTSLPELATSIVAAKKGQADIAIGNVVGSNLFNILFILGATASISPVSTAGIRNTDFIALISSSVLLWIASRYYGTENIKRLEGFIFLTFYVAYVFVLLH